MVLDGPVAALVLLTFAAAVLVMCVGGIVSGIVSAIAPRYVWYLRGGWKFKQIDALRNVEPPWLVLLGIRMKGLVSALLSLLIPLIVFLSLGRPRLESTVSRPQRSMTSGTGAHQSAPGPDAPRK